MLNEHTLRAALLMLMHDEGCKLKPYQCTGNKWTIGFGRNFEDNPLSLDEQEQLFGVAYLDWHELLGHLMDEGITRTQAEWLLLRDIKVTHKLMLSNPKLKHIRGQCSDIRWAALLNMGFQMGLGSLLMFRQSLSYADAGNWMAASIECIDSKWAKQTKSRARRISVVLRTDSLEAYH